MTSTELATVAVSDRINAALMQGDLSGLSATEKREYYLATCKSLGLNPLTKPFEYLNLNGKEFLYARKDCTEQLRHVHRVSASIVSREVVEGVYVVTARATLPGNALGGGMVQDRTDESIGAVAIEQLRGEARANAMMKAETKAKRRVTLSICGLGILDESEVESIPNARREPYDADTGEVTDSPTSAQLTQMHVARIAISTTVEGLRQAGEAIKADEARIAKGDLAYLRGMAKQQKSKIQSAHRHDTEPAPPDALKDAAL